MPSLWREIRFSVTRYSRKLDFAVKGIAHKLRMNLNGWSTENVDQGQKRLGITGIGGDG